MPSASEQPTIYIIAGPNGAGKTTFASRYLPESVACQEFLNADLIAAGLSPFAPETQSVRAAELMLERLRALVDSKETFSFETTLGARTYARWIPTWQSRGYRVVLFFLWLPSPELAIQRVAARVEQGGHDIPDSIIRRRYSRGLKNLLNLYAPLLDELQVYDASQLPPIPVAKLEKGQETVVDQEKWTIIGSTLENRNEHR